MSVRALDLICPIGMGQRALVISSPGLGKTTFLKDICHAVLKGYPEIKVNCVLIDERPEEVSDFVRSVDADVYASSMDQRYDHHIQLVDGILEKSFQEAASGHHVMILLELFNRFKLDSER